MAWTATPWGMETRLPTWRPGGRRMMHKALSLVFTPSPDRSDFPGELSESSGTASSLVVGVLQPLEGVVARLEGTCGDAEHGLLGHPPRLEPGGRRGDDARRALHPLELREGVELGHHGHHVGGHDAE